MIFNHPGKQEKKNHYSSFLILPVLFLFLVSTSGCTVIVSSATSDMMEELSHTIVDNNDLQIVETGAPAYLIMIDSLIRKDPHNEEMLAQAALLYTAYSNIFVSDSARSQKMASKALSYANQAICLTQKTACALKEMDFDAFEKTIKKIKKKEVPTLFALGNSWAAWIMVNKSDFNAIADISRIESIMLHIIEIDPGYRDGS
ncbi:MAG: hypothetical protein HN417_11445, partial [Desulfobacula sp.]|nr:hypothetical protein [Desulfobacula sp.]